MTHINTIWCQISTLSSRHHYLVIVTCWRKTVATFFSLILSAAAYFCIAATTAGVAMSDGVNREYHTSSLDSMDGVGGKKKKRSTFLRLGRQEESECDNAGDDGLLLGRGQALNDKRYAAILNDYCCILRICAISLRMQSGREGGGKKNQNQRHVAA